MDFTMHSGNSKRLHFSIADGSSEGNPLDITDAVVVWKASKGTAARFSATPVLTKTTDAGITVTDEMNGAFTVDLMPEDTESLLGSFYHEVELRDASGDVVTAFTGEFKVLRSLIR